MDFQKNDTIEAFSVTSTDRMIWWLIELENRYHKDS
jgi:hypothetical protein